MSSLALADASTLNRAPATHPLALVPTNAADASGETPKSIDARRLFQLEQVEVAWEGETGTLWTFMRPRGRPNYNLDILEDFHAWQRGIIAAFEDRQDDLKYLVVGSRVPGVFNLGGDLELFATKIRAGDRQALVAYGESCVRILHRNLNALDLPMITIGLVQGDALGGGFESLLSFNVVIAERGAKFGFPETMFGLFPGMGAYSLVARRVGSAIAEEMILSGRIYSAEEMKERGLVHIIAEPGQGITVARDYIERNKRRHKASHGVYQTGREVNPLSLAELDRIVQIWADACMQLRERDLKLMQRLLAAQDRMRPGGWKAAG